MDSHFAILLIECYPTNTNISLSRLNSPISLLSDDNEQHPHRQGESLRVVPASHSWKKQQHQDLISKVGSIYK
jgi:hypothetical protein